MDRMRDIMTGGFLLEGRRELDRLVEERILIVSAYLRIILQQKGELGKVTADGTRLVKFASHGTDFTVKTGYDPLFTPIAITTAAHRAARNWDCGVEWGPANGANSAADWLNDLGALRRECTSIVGSLDALYQRLKSECA